MNAIETLRAAAEKERTEWSTLPWKNSDSARVHHALANLLDHIAGLVELNKEVQHGQTTVLALAIARTITEVKE